MLHNDNNDISAFYAAAKMKHIGEHTIYDSRSLNALAEEEGITCGVNNYLYPPIWAEVLSPFTFLPFQQFRLIWLVLSHLLMFLLLVISVRIIDRTGDSQRHSSLVLAAFVTFVLLSTFEREFHYGQINILLAVLLFLPLVLDTRKHYLFLGACIAFCATIKLGPLLLLFYFLINKDYKVIWASTGFIIIFVTLSFTLFGGEDWVIYFRDVLPSFTTQMYPSDVSRSVTLETTNYSMINFLRLSSAGFGIPVPMSVINLLHKVFGVVLLLGSGYLCWTHRKNRRPGIISVQIIVIVMLLLSPFLWHAHLVFTAPGFVFAGYLLVRDRLAKMEIILLLSSFILIASADFWPKLPFGEGNPLLVLRAVKFPAIVAYLWMFTNLLHKNRYAAIVGNSINGDSRTLAG